MNHIINRRQFIARTGTLAVAFTTGLPKLSLAGEGGGTSSLGVRDSNEEYGYLCIGADNRITILSGKVELGTGVQTALTQIIVEQLPIDLDRVDYVQGDTDRTPNGGYTAGSNTIRFESPRMRLAAATAREHLLQLAGAEFGVPRKALRIHDGRISVGKRRKHHRHSRTWAELIGDQAIALVLDEDAVVVEPKRHRVIGTSVPRIELPDKLLNRFRYLQDVAVDGMKHARVVRPNGRNSHYLGHDDGALPSGVEVVQEGDFVAIVADDEWDAIRSLRLLKVDWEEGPDLVPQTELPARLRDDDLVYSVTDNDDGSFEEALNTADTVLSADYFTPYQMHGSFAPSCAVADVRTATDGTITSATVWSGTQGVYQLRGAIAGLLDVDPSLVRVIYMETAGCYGHIGVDDAAADAALVSLKIGAPVRVQWTRQDEHRWEPLGPAMSHAMRGGVNPGEVVAWEHTVWTPPHSSRPGNNPGHLLAGHALGHLPGRLPSQTGNAGGRNSQVNYVFPHDRLVGYVVRNFDTDPDDPDNRAPAEPLVWVLPRSTALRTLGGLSNCFANESFFDELIHVAGLDPVQARIDALPDPRARAVVRAAAKKARWKKKRRKNDDDRSSDDDSSDDNSSGASGKKGTQASAGVVRGRGIGYNQYETDDSYVAIIVDVAVDLDTGVIQVVKAVVAHDCGQIINPDGLKAQIQGNVIQGVSRTLIEEVEYRGDSVTTRVWQTAPPFNPGAQYDVVRYDQVPEIEIVLIDRPQEPPYGAGEPTIGSMPGAIGNAVFDATGVRIRTLPMTPDRVLAELAAAKS